MESEDCKYCDDEYQYSERTVIENDFWFGNFDKHPVRPGHMKIIPRRHVNSVEELVPQELLWMPDIFDKAKRKIEERFRPDGFNVGYNEGEAAGQTVPHLHLHLMPRYKGDCEDPTGGVRKIDPEKGNYLKWE